MGISSPTRMQMKHVQYAAILRALMLAKQRQGLYVRAADIYECFPEVPYKIIKRKLERLIDRGIIEGCACGCSTVLSAPYSRPLYEVVETFHEDRLTWTDTIRPIDFRRIYGLS